MSHFIYSPYKQLINKRLTFTYGKVDKYNISTWGKRAYNLRAHSRNINSWFLFITTSYMCSPVNG